MGKCLLEDVIELLVSEKFHLNSKSYAVNIIVHFGKKGRKEGRKNVCKYEPKKIYWNISHFAVAALLFQSD